MSDAEPVVGQTARQEGAGLHVARGVGTGHVQEVRHHVGGHQDVTQAALETCDTNVDSSMLLLPQVEISSVC